MSDSPQYVTCNCQHCDGGIEFDASGFEKGETRAVECPHCHVETVIFVPERVNTPAAISQAQETKESIQLIPYMGFKCEICDQAIEAENVRLGETITCPHCKCTQFIPRKNLEFAWGAQKQTDPDIAGARHEDSSETPQCIQKAAEQGDAEAQYNLGVCYANGQGVAKDEAEAVKWYRKAAEQNLALAQLGLAVCYGSGKGVAKDEGEAVKWYRKAAEQNGLAAVAAQIELFSMYDTGRGVPQDDVAAVEWIRKAAEQGCAVTQTLLGIFYANGHVVPQDLVQAHVWLSLGGANGDESAREALAKTEKYMTPEQKAEAAKLAGGLFEKFRQNAVAEWSRRNAKLASELFEKIKSQGPLTIES
jgi:TPR repeat protein